MAAASLLAGAERSDLEPFVRGCLAEGGALAFGRETRPDVRRAFAAAAAPGRVLSHLAADVPDGASRVAEDPFSLPYVSGLLRGNATFTLLRIGQDVDAGLVFAYYYSLVEEGGLVVADRSPALDGVLDALRLEGHEPADPAYLGRFSSLHRADDVVVLRREPVARAVSFAIVMATYQRRDGSSRDSVERSIGSIRAQPYTDYKLFLIGDDYEDGAEFERFRALLPAHRMEALNLPVAVERRFCKMSANHWSIGGATAMNYGIEMAERQGYTHYVHLDDDDLWHRHHLRNVAAAYEQYPEAAFVCTAGLMGTWLLPKVSRLGYGNFRCQAQAAFHSSYGFRLDRIPHRYKTLIPGQEELAFPPADAELLERVGRYCDAHELKVLALPIISCLHDTECADV